MNPERRPPLALGMADESLMLAVQAGDDDAFAELVRRHARSLLHWFYLQSLDHDLAEDLAQEVWEKVWRARAEYEPRARFKAFLFRIARNHWIDRFRRHARRPAELPLEDEDSERGPALSQRLEAEVLPPSHALDREEFAQAIARHIAELPPAMREVFLLGEVEGLPYAEVAELLEIPIGTVKSRMFHAVRRLQLAMGDPW